jgi:hypothetical protein
MPLNGDARLVVLDQSPATSCAALLRLLHAVDCFPRGNYKLVTMNKFAIEPLARTRLSTARPRLAALRVGGLYTGYYAVAAASRYERFWTEIMKWNVSTAMPPLDIAFAWYASDRDAT